MKNIIFMCILICLFSCKKENTIDKISISGIVSDSNETPIDSVKITIEETCFMCMGSLPIDTEYSDPSGGYTFEFIPKKDHSYHLNFEKLGYTIKTYHPIDLKNESQVFNVIMDSK